MPSLWDKDLWRDLPVDFQPGKYYLPIGAIEINKRRTIKVNYYDASAGFAEPHLVKGLFSHLSTSGASKFTELVGNKGKLNNLTFETKKYSQALMEFLKLIKDNVEEYKTKVNFHDEMRPGLTGWFILTIWKDAIDKAGGYIWIDDSWYKPIECIPDISLLKLNCGGNTIGIAKTRKTLKTYEKWHKKLRTKYAEHPLAKEICARIQEINNLVQDIRQRLHEFNDIDHLPGKCDLC